METQTQIQKPETKTLKGLMESPSIKSKLDEILSRNSQPFISAVLTMVQNNEMLKNADPVSIYQAALTAATLDLEVNSNLGFAYIVPFRDNKAQKINAQFQIGYKGFIQLAQRTGLFQTISATPVFEGQLIEENPLTGYVFDWSKKNSDKIIGFASYFKLLNGFEKTLYMSTEALKAHGFRYSQSYKNEKTRPYSLWETNFEAMGIKTVIKLLISKYAPLTTKMQQAVLADQAVIVEDEKGEPDYQYPDNEQPQRIEEPKPDTTIEKINAFTDKTKLMAYKLNEGGNWNDEQFHAYQLKLTALEG